MTAKRWGAWTALVAAGIACISVYPFRGVGGGAPWLDKVVHVCEYLVLAWSLRRTLRASGLTGQRGVAWSALVSLAYGAIMEGVQAVLPYRSADWHDMGANAAGTALGLAAAAFGRRA